MKPWMQGAALGAAVGLACWGIGAAGAVDRLEETAVGLRFQAARAFPKILGCGPASPEVVVIPLTPRDLEWGASWDGVGGWPWPRSVYRLLCEELAKQKPAAVLFDFLFTEEREAEDDAAFAEGLKGLGVAHLGAAFVQGDWNAPPGLSPFPVDGRADLLPAYRHRKLELPAPRLLASGAGAGFLTHFADEAGEQQVGSLPLLVRVSGGIAVPHLTLDVFLRARGATGARMDAEGRLGIVGGTKIPLRDGRLPIYWRDLAEYVRSVPGPDGRRHPVTFATLLEPALRRSGISTGPPRGASEGAGPDLLPPDLLTGKVVVLGSVVAGHDRLPTPLGPDIPGVALHASVMDSLLTGRFLRYAPAAAGLLLCVLPAGLLGALILSAKNLFRSAGWSALIAAGVAALSLLAFARLTLVPVVPAALALLGTWGLGEGIRFLREKEARSRVESAFGRFLSPELVDEVMGNPDLRPQVGARREVTILYSDIRGFTTLSEGTSPEEMVRLLNEYFSAMTEVVVQEGGYLDKYIGDAILAIFGAPVPLKDHADRAARTAVRMQRRLAELNVRWKSQGRPPVRIGIGLNTGPAVVGFIGYEQKLSYTAIGDTVNVAQRLEAATKEFPIGILASAAVLRALTIPVDSQPLGEIHVKGRAEGLQVFSIAVRGDGGVPGPV